MISNRFFVDSANQLFPFLPMTTVEWIRKLCVCDLIGL
jgi:hypothetical protein